MAAAIAAMLAGAVALPGAGPASARPGGFAPGPVVGGEANPNKVPPKVRGKGSVDRPRGATPKPLDRNASRRAKPVAKGGEAGAPKALNAPAASTRKVALRALVLHVGSDDWGLATWRSTLDKVGAAYDTRDVRTNPITAADLVRPDGTGKYNAILLSNNLLGWTDAGGNFVSMPGQSWLDLWAYEKDFAVRQATLFTSYGTWPEDYCLRPVSEGGVTTTPLNAQLTSAGNTFFDYLKPGTTVPILHSYVYRNSIQPGCAAEALFTQGSNVLGVRSVAADGRERAALTFSSNEYLLQSDLLVFGMFRWASRGLHLGEKRHYFKADVDDVFNTGDLINADGSVTSGGYQMSAKDMYSTHVAMQNIRSTYPRLSQFKLTLAYNGEGANVNAGSTCSPNGGTAQLTATAKCLKAQFEWINHTFTHLEQNHTTYAQAYSEITQNITRAQQLGLTVDPTVLKTGEYSGLGVYHPDPDNDIDPPTDYGLNASNPNLLSASQAAGVKYLHGNMSFVSHQPPCFNCSIRHPMNSTIYVVPDWPTNISYHAGTPAGETAFYNSYYGPNGLFPYWPVNQTYTQIIGHESDQALSHIAQGSIYTHTLHIPNMKDYGQGKSLTSDWVTAIGQKYSTYYSVPLLSPTWGQLAQTTVDKNSHFSLKNGVDAVYDPVTKRVTLRSSTAGKVHVSGVTAGSSTTYGTSRISTVTLAANTPVSGAVTLLP